MRSVGERIWRVDGTRPGRSVCIAFGVHGDERSPIDAGRGLVDALRARELASGSLLLVHGNPRASEEGRRCSRGGVDLNRCFHQDVLAGASSGYEECRAREIVAALDAFGLDVLVDFHCTVEPGRRFAMHHPSVDHAPHRAVTRLLSAGVVLGDPALRFGAVSLDEWASTRGRVGICYETGWMGDPSNTPDLVRAEMENLLRGLGLLDGPVRTFDDPVRLELFGRIQCVRDGFRWEPGVGENLQELARGTRLGAYSDGTPVILDRDAALVFPKKRPDLVQRGKPLVYLARRR